MKHGPWEILDSKKIYKSPWIEVKEDKVLTPDKKKGIYSTVKFNDSVHILPIQNNTVYLAEQFRYALGKQSIEVPSGCVDSGEIPIDAAKRELKEELGITAKKITLIGTIAMSPSSIKGQSYLYIAENLEFGEQNLDGNEIIKKMELPFNEALKLALNSEIQHNQSAILILKKHIMDTEKNL